MHSFPNNNNNNNNKVTNILDFPKERGNRYYNHTQPFGNVRNNNTALSNYSWGLKKETSEIPKLTWSILKIVQGYSNISKRCLLCLNEKLYIATYHDQEELLNKRSKLI